MLPDATLFLMTPYSPTALSLAGFRWYYGVVGILGVSQTSHGYAFTRCEKITVPG